MRVSFLIPLGYKKVKTFWNKEKTVHCHYLRDWSGTEVPAYLVFPPIDQMTAAAYVREQGHEVQFIDGNISHNSHNELALAGAAFDPDWVILSSGWESQEWDLAFGKQLKAVCPKCRIAISGPNVTHDPKSVLGQESPVDVVILGEMEGGLRGILSGDLQDNCVIKEADGTISKGRRTLIEDLDAIPFPARDLVSNESYRLPFAKHNPVTSLLASRGCPHSKCSFCAGNLYSMGRIRYRSAENVLQELEEVRFKYKIPEVMFRDQCFGADRRIAVEICEGLIERKRGLSWRASMRVDLVDREYLQLLGKAGCHSISFGFESPDQEVLDYNNKGIRIEQSIQAAKWAKEAGMEISGGFLLALMDDKPNSHRDIFRFAVKLGVDYPQFNITTVFPSTEISSKVNASESVGAHYGQGCPLNNSQVDAKQLRRRLSWLYFRFYFRPGYILDQIKKVRSPGDVFRLLRTAWAIFVYPLFYGKAS